ncbi:glycosyltransferase [Alicyclobacillus acidocaldarius]|uniref:Glycosyl transferase group 1 n=1 Tax=Alicyclobacillus acidocaldarius subsp. acidocaldarius (strain ATCC 27009 / DSM 446 / BCRC 14685 / JCM 5260 / KCTC 1825 / NBRC 15652 / NCIMB 11725 / NRRL B-14509 / 104-IA) TaxID=521098 RepID=C8WRD1_ALIAD|nr:glycosyltransferase [Alicyclobacillus acidocaldarius]ACV57336.1 glycosyl transferase group 1 [Alicyclobacillus acidocaldarius subsp. acidocaldarius DSM 446]
MKVALVHDWLVDFAGSERVLFELAKLFPDAPIYTSVYSERALANVFPKERVRTSFLQKIPLSVKRYRSLLPFLPFAFEMFDLTGYDVIISSSHACAKGVVAGSNSIHICYCHTPMRYAWSHYHQYLRGVRGTLKRATVGAILSWLRTWDFIAAQRVDFFIANSSEVQKRIRHYYRRDAVVIHPPISAPEGENGDPERADFYLYLGRLVEYKRVDLLVDAFRHLPSARLIVAGDGPEMNRLRRSAPLNVEFAGKVTEDEKWDLLRRAKALLFPAHEDFGIVIGEARAVGTPVIGLAQGGVLDYAGDPGVLPWIKRQNLDDVKMAVDRFERESFNSDVYEKYLIQTEDSFRNAVARLVDDLVANKKGESRVGRAADARDH